MPPSSAARLTHKVALAQARGALLIELAPTVAHLPAPIQKYDDPFLPYSRAIIGVTSALAAGYVFDVASYLALGAAGAIALERSVALVDADSLTVLHGPFHSGWAQFASDGGLNVDAATVIDEDAVAGFEFFGVRGLLTSESLSNILTIEGIEFQLVRQEFLDQFVRDDFTEALHRAIEWLR